MVDTARALQVAEFQVSASSVGDESSVTRCFVARQRAPQAEASTRSRSSPVIFKAVIRSLYKERVFTLQRTAKASRLTTVARVHIFDVEAPNAQGYRWRWQSPDGTASSACDFDLFYDCVADARANGHEARVAPRQKIPRSEQQREHDAEPPAESLPARNRGSPD